MVLWVGRFLNGLGPKDCSDNTRLLSWGPEGGPDRLNTSRTARLELLYFIFSPNSEYQMWHFWRKKFVLDHLDALSIKQGSRLYGQGLSANVLVCHNFSELSGRSGPNPSDQCKFWYFTLKVCYFLPFFYCLFSLGLQLWGYMRIMQFFQAIKTIM